jgi:hypothetical protein
MISLWGCTDHQLIVQVLAGEDTPSRIIVHLLLFDVTIVISIKVLSLMMLYE